MATKKKHPQMILTDHGNYIVICHGIQFFFNPKTKELLNPGKLKPHTWGWACNTFSHKPMNVSEAYMEKVLEIANDLKDRSYEHMLDEKVLVRKKLGGNKQEKVVIPIPEAKPATFSFGEALKKAGVSS